MPVAGIERKTASVLFAARVQVDTVKENLKAGKAVLLDRPCSTPVGILDDRGSESLGFLSAADFSAPESHELFWTSQDTRNSSRLLEPCVSRRQKHREFRQHLLNRLLEPHGHICSWWELACEARRFVQGFLKWSSR